MRKCSISDWWLLGNSSSDLFRQATCDEVCTGPPFRVVADPGTTWFRPADLRLFGDHRQPGKLIVADFGLGDQDTAVKMPD